MRLFPKILNKNKTDIIKKSYHSLNLNKRNCSLIGISTAGKMQWHQISNYTAWTYYMRVAVVYNAIDIISQAFSVIEPAIWDNAEQRYLTSQDKNIKALDLLELLKRPSFGKSYNEFAREIVPNYLVTGDLYFRIKAINENDEPVELQVINSKDVSPEEDCEEGNAIKYYVSFVGGENIFNKDPKNGRFYNPNKIQELWHTKIFNPTNKVKGFSPLNPLFYEIEQFIASSVHNGNMLKQGARPSGVLNIEPEFDLNDKNYQKIKEEIHKFYQGESNTGNILILQGGKQFEQLSISNKDMDFSTLKKTITEQIYRNLKIPMSLVLSESMTLDNFKMAIPVLYKMAVLPLADILFQELNLFLMHRYDDTERYELTYNKKDIDALSTEFNLEIDRLIKTELLTINEGRGLLGLPPLIGEAGNQIARPSNLLPVGTVAQNKQITKEKYAEILRNNNFNEKQINSYIEKYYSDNT